MNRSLGVALIPAEHICTRMYQIVSALSEELELSFMLAPGASIPHVSLMQGVFTTECAERFVDEFLTGPLPATYVEKRYPLSETAYLWDGRILFFNLAYSPDLRALHEEHESESVGSGLMLREFRHLHQRRDLGEQDR